ncbi:hypothetical protein MPLB_1280107 [Mesorhizobium sp. ORS 3324]|nr:hypothetical protein MPLB_1280107 [Mesorhizobium sp. ORS 3324]
MPAPPIVASSTETASRIQAWKLSTPGLSAAFRGIVVKAFPVRDSLGSGGFAHYRRFFRVVSSATWDKSVAPAIGTGLAARSSAPKARRVDEFRRRALGLVVMRVCALLGDMHWEGV